MSRAGRRKRFRVFAHLTQGHLGDSMDEYATVLENAFHGRAPSSGEIEQSVVC